MMYQAPVYDGTADGEGPPAAEPRLHPRRLAADAHSPAPPRPPAPLAPSPSSSATAVNPWTLAFVDPALEAAFSRYHANAMWRTDLAAILLHVLFYSILLFTPGPLGHMAWKLPWHTIIRGHSYCLFLPLILTPRLRPWYLRHRDAAMLCIFVGMSAYMWSVCNHQPWVDPAFATHPMFQGGFSWIAFSLLFFQPRIPAHRAGSALLAATQMPALHNYCATHHGAALGRCMAWGAFKVSLLALLPHFGVYCLEGRARRLFLQAAARQLQASPDLD